MRFNKKRWKCPSSYFVGKKPDSVGSIVVPAELGEDDFLVYNLKAIEYASNGVNIAKNAPRSVLWACMGHFVLTHDLFYMAVCEDDDGNEIEDSEGNPVLEKLRFDFSLLTNDSIRLPRSFERWLFRDVLIPLVNEQYSEKKSAEPHAAGSTNKGTGRGPSDF